MGAKDIAAKLFFGRPDIAADLYNAILFDGMRVLSPDDIQELSTEYPDYQLGARFRDITHLCKVRINGQVRYLIVGVEIQSRQDPSMVGRILEYDGRVIKWQVRWKKRRLGDLLPVVTIVIYLGESPWRCPSTLRGSVASLGEELDGLVVPDYYFHVLDMRRPPEKFVGKLFSEFNWVVNCFSHSRDKDAFLHWIVDEKSTSRHSKEAVELINQCLNFEFKIREDEEDVDMCKAARELKREWKMEGKKEGRQEGMQKGIQKGMQEGMQKGRQEGMQKGIGWMLSLGISLDDIARVTGAKLDEISKIKTQMGLSTP